MTGTLSIVPVIFYIDILMLICYFLYLKYIIPKIINQMGVKKIAFLVVAFTNSKQNTNMKNAKII